MTSWCSNSGLGAMSGETNRLLGLASALSERPVPRELDVLLATGEQTTIALLAIALHARGCPAESFTGAQVRVLTDSAHTKARIRDIEASRILAAVAEGKVAVVAGFQGVNEEGNTTTLGRGGSDTSAVALAAALKAEECQIFTHVQATRLRGVPNFHRCGWRLHHRPSSRGAGASPGQHHL